MITLSGKVDYLVFFGHPRAQRLKIVPCAPKSKNVENAYFRTSPIFPSIVDGKREIDFLGTWDVVFFGPASPDAASAFLGKKDRYWVTLGVLNNIIAYRIPYDADRLVTYCKRNKIPFERISILNGSINKYRKHFFPEVASLCLGFEQTETSLPEINHVLSELGPLISMISVRALPIRKSLHRPILDYIDQVKRIIAKAAPQDSTPSSGSTRGSKSPSSTHGGHNYFNAHGDLQKINTGLARFAAQACVCIPPLSNHECHYWAHSALGIGTPVFGLFTLVEHIYNAIALKRIPERFAALCRQDFPKTLPIEARDGYEADLNEVHLPAPQDDGTGPVLSLPFFSGRDGFQSNAYSVSVPLTSLVAATNNRWSLCNITHELSHDIIGAVLARHLIPAKSISNSKQYIQQIIKSGGTPSIGEYIKRQFLLSVLGFSSDVEYLDNPSENGINAVVYTEAAIIADQIDTLLDHVRIDIEEIMVHAFDFLYFYRCNSERYIRTIWSSWATIPDVERRVPRYIIRTLCALSLHPDSKKNPRYAHNKLVSVLNTLKTEHGVEACCEQALSYLRANRLNIERDLSLRWSMADLVKRFLFSPVFLNDLHGEEASGKSFSLLKFDEKMLTNPLAFAYRHGSENGKISPAASAWLYNCLAYSYSKGAHVS